MSGINVNFIGRLGMDAEIKQTKNGVEFIVMKVACDEFKGNKVSTAWMNVYDWSDRTKKMIPYLKKGSLINVQGMETISPYLSRSGEPLYSRDVSAFNVDFVNVGKKQESDAQQKEEIKIEVPSISNTDKTEINNEELPF